MSERKLSCVKELKKYGDKAAIKRGEDAYNNAKAEYDGIIQGLIVALAREGEPASLPNLEARMQRGFETRIAFCSSVDPLVPSSAGKKGPEWVAALGGPIGLLIEAIKDICLRGKDDDALMRKTIETQLQATSWPAFASIAPSL